MRKNKHISLDDRIEILERLNKGITFKAIGPRIRKDSTTVSKEVKLLCFSAILMLPIKSLTGRIITLCLEVLLKVVVLLIISLKKMLI
ncbi:MAG: helix-turn-helix domain-containing protein [Clostridia bacterium]|nr:helix-turn-helix domain-containing protein [Clostridia bacterium]